MLKFKNYKTIILIIASLSFTITKMAYADNYPQNDNIFCLRDADNKGVSINFVQNNYHFTATDLSTWGGVTGVVGGYEDGCMDILASQHLSTSVTDWVRDKLNQNNIIPSWDGDYMIDSDYNSLNTNPPRELAFAVIGDLEIYAKETTYICPNVAIAQGKDHAGHNWWMFDNNGDKPQSLKCEDSNNNTIYLYLNGDVSMNSIQYKFKPEA